MNANFYLVVGAKGGSGATTLCVDLAKAIRQAGKRAAIVDADLSGRRAVGELLGGTRRLDAARIETIHAMATIDDIDVVEIVSKYEDVAALRPLELEDVATRLGEIEGIVLVDVPRPLEHYVVPFVRRGIRIVVVAEPELLGGSAARTTVRDLTRFGFPLDRLWLVTNDRDKRQTITARELGKLIGLPIVAEVPRHNDRRAYDRIINALARRMIDTPAEMPFMHLPSLARFVATDFSTRSRRRSDLSALAISTGENPLSIARAAQDQTEARKQKRDRIRREINDQMMSRVDLVAASASHSDGEKMAELRITIDDLIDKLVSSRDDAADLTLEDRAEIKREILDEQLGLGPLEDLMRDPAVSEIMVNGPNKIFVERAGKITRSHRTFQSDRQLRVVIERIVAPLGRRIDESSPMVDARLPDGSRVNAIIEPLAIRGATLTIRRFGIQRLTAGDLVSLGSLPSEAVAMLEALVSSRHNIIVSGGTGSGKTTFLNVLSTFIPGDERIVTIEDSAELNLSQDNVVSLESRPANVEGRGAVSIRDLMKNALRMRPDRIVIGECRGGEALDMLQAMNSGHDGSLTTLHANTARDAVARLETLVLMAGFDLPIRAIREQIASAIDIIVQIDRMRDGSRKVVSINEVVGINDDQVVVEEIIRYQARGIDDDGAVVGAFQVSASRPHFLKRCEELGVPFDERLLVNFEPIVVEPRATPSSGTKPQIQPVARLRDRRKSP